MSKTALLVIDVQRVSYDDDTISPCPSLSWEAAVIRDILIENERVAAFRTIATPVSSWLSRHGLIQKGH